MDVAVNLHALWTALANDPVAVSAIIAAIIAVLGVLFSALLSSIISRRALYISSVTAERSKWIDKLRTNISKLVGELGYLHFRIYRDETYLVSPEHSNVVRGIEALITEVRLQLNPDGQIDANIISLLAVMPELTGDQDYRVLEGLFVRHVQWLLKAEWEKVKFEARGFLVRYLWEWPKRLFRDRAYQNFVAASGSIADYQPTRSPH